jgi:hypothetical protein
MTKPWKSIEFWAAVAFVAVTAAVIVLFNPSRNGAMNLANRNAYHWLAAAGSAYLALVTPAFIYLKRRYKEKYQATMKFHVMGNLAALLLITFHATFQSSASIIKMTLNFLGPALYASLVLLLITGFMMRFHLSGKYWPQFKSLHVSLVTTFYVTVFFHVLSFLLNR